MKNNFSTNYFRTLCSIISDDENNFKALISTLILIASVTLILLAILIPVVNHPIVITLTLFFLLKYFVGVNIINHSLFPHIYGSNGISHLVSNVLYHIGRKITFSHPNINIFIPLISEYDYLYILKDITIISRIEL